MGINQMTKIRKKDDKPGKRLTDETEKKDHKPGINAK